MNRYAKAIRHATTTLELWAAYVAYINNATRAETDALYDEIERAIVDHPCHEDFAQLSGWAPRTTET